MSAIKGESVLAGECILIIEDDPELLEFLLTSVLLPRGYLVNIANHGQQGLSGAKAQRPDLVLLDLGIDDITSSEILQQLEACGDPPVVLMTPQGKEAEALRTFRLGTRDAVIKPFTAEEMIQVIARVLHQERLAGERDRLVRKLAAANEELERSLMEAQTLYDKGKSILSSWDLQGVFSAVIRAAVSITNAEEGYLLLQDADGEKLYLRAVQLLGQDHLIDMHVPVQDSIADHVLHSGEPVILSSEGDASIYIGCKHPLAKSGCLVRSLVNVPLKGEKGVVGVLGVGNINLDQGFLQRDVQLLSAVADYAMIAIKNAQTRIRSEQTLNRQGQERLALQALDTAGKTPGDIQRIAQQALTHAVEITGAVDGVVGLLPAALCAGAREGNGKEQEIIWINYDASSTQPEPYLGTFVQQVLKVGQPEWMQNGSLPKADGPAHPFTLAAAPIRQGDRAVGAIGLCVANGSCTAPDHHAVATRHDVLPFLDELANRCAERLNHTHLLSDVAAAQQRSDLILQSLSEGVYTVDTDFCFTSVNPAMERMTGWKESELLGQRYDEILAPEANGQRLRLEDSLPKRALHTESKVVSDQGTIRHKDGHRIPVNKTAAVLRAADASAIGVLSTVRDLTAEVELRQLRQQFVALVAHELHAPLTRVSSSLKALLHADLPGDMQREILDMLKTQSLQLDQLTDEILDKRRLEANLTAHDHYPVTLKPIVDQIVKHFRKAASGRSFQVTLAPDLPFLIGDAHKIELALTNLIESALILGDGQQPILISAEPSDNRVVVAVEGPNLAVPLGGDDEILSPSNPLDDQSALGGKPLLGRPTPDTDMQIARNLIQAQGGEFWIENRPGTNIRFCFSLPQMEATDEE
jgi:PAS domain S-box-containing protein